VKGVFGRNQDQTAAASMTSRLTSIRHNNPVSGPLGREGDHDAVH
jgi:hypothetical protein